MGHPGSVSRLVCGVKRDRKLEIRVNELVELLQCADWFQRVKPHKPLTCNSLAGCCQLVAKTLLTTEQIDITP
jgi:hypothetical protein